MVSWGLTQDSHVQGILEYFVLGYQKLLSVLWCLEDQAYPRINHGFFLLGDMYSSVATRDHHPSMSEVSRLLCIKDFDNFNGSLMSICTGVTIILCIRQYALFVWHPQDNPRYSRIVCIRFNRSLHCTARTIPVCPGY